MEKTIQINNKDVTFKTSAALPRLYMTMYGRDIFADMMRLEGTNEEQALDGTVINILEDVAFCMARHADKSVGNDVVEWLEGFDTFGVIKALPEILALWRSEMETSSVPESSSEQ